MKPLYQTKVRTADGKLDHGKIAGEIENAHPDLIRTKEHIRWRPPGHGTGSVHSTDVFIDPATNQKVVVDGDTWDVYHVDSVTRVNDQNRTADEEKQWEAERPAREEAERTRAEELRKLAEGNAIEKLQEQNAELQRQLTELTSRFAAFESLLQRDEMQQKLTELEAKLENVSRADQGKE